MAAPRCRAIKLDLCKARPCVTKLPRRHERVAVPTHAELLLLRTLQVHGLMACRPHQVLMAHCMQVRDVSARVASLERAPAVQRSSGSRSVTAHFRDSEIVSVPALAPLSRTSRQAAATSWLSCSHPSCTCAHATRMSSCLAARPIRMEFRCSIECAGVRAGAGGAGEVDGAQGSRPAAADGRADSRHPGVPPQHGLLRQPPRRGAAAPSSDSATSPCIVQWRLAVADARACSQPAACTQPCRPRCTA